MKCSNCGNEVIDGLKVCSICGMNVEQPNYNNQMQDNVYNMGQPMNNQMQNGAYNMGQPTNNQMQNGAYNMGQPINNQYNRNQQMAYQFEEPVIVQNSNKYKSNGGMNYIALISAILLVVSLFLPFIQYGTYFSKSLMDGKDSVFFLPIAVLTILFAILKFSKGITVVGCIGLLFAFLEVYLTNDQMNNMPFGKLLERGSGFYLLIVASFGIIISEYIMSLVNKK